MYFLVFASMKDVIAFKLKGLQNTVTQMIQTLKHVPLTGNHSLEEREQPCSDAHVTSAEY